MTVRLFVCLSGREVRWAVAIAVAVATICIQGKAALIAKMLFRKFATCKLRPAASNIKAERKAAWDCAREQVRAILQAQLLRHAGEDLPSAVLASCADKVCQLAPVVDTEAEKMKVALSFAKHVLHDLLRTEGPAPLYRTSEEWGRLFPRYPSAGDGFMKCYDPSDAEGIRQSLDRYGLCVVRVFAAPQCDASVAAMFEEINVHRAQKGVDGPAVDPEDPATWFTSNWPSGSKFLLNQVALHEQAFKNRCSRSIHEAFAGIFGERRLHVSIDNWGVHRGAKDNPKWAVGLKPHWDLNPWRYVQEIKEGFDPGYQGLVALTDQNLETGCHLTLPGCTRFAAQWCRERRLDDVNKSRRSHRAADDDPVIPYMQAIPLRKGQMVIWSWGQLHGSCGSSGQKMRLQQYIRMYPAPEAGNRRYEQHDRFACTRILRTCLKRGELTESDVDNFALESFGRCLLGLKQWPSDGDA